MRNTTFSLSVQTVVTMLGTSKESSNILSETSCFFDLKNGTYKQNYYGIIRKTLIDKQLLRPEVTYSNQMTCLVIMEAFFPLIRVIKEKY